MNRKGKSNSFLTSAAILAVGSLFTRLLGIFFKIPLSSTVGDYGLGLYSIAYPLYSTFLAISIAGLPIAVSKMVAERVSVGNYKGAYRVFYTALSIMAVLGLIGSLLMYFGANTLIVWFNWPQDAYYSIIALSFAPFFVALLSAVRGFFQGMQRMTYSSASQIIEQIARVAVGIALAVVLTRKLGVVYGAAGATFGAVAGAIVALVYMYVSFFMFRKKQADLLSQQVEETDENNKVVMKTLIMLAIPVAIGGIVNTVMGLINSVTLTSLLQGIGYTETAATELLGVLEQKAQTLVSIPMVAGTALSASLVPSISESIMKKEKALISLKTSLAVRVGLLISLPSAIGLSVLSEPIMGLVFLGDSAGYELMISLAFVAIFNVMMTSLQGVLQGSGRFYKPLKNLAIGIAVKFLLNVILISRPAIGIYGATYSSVIASAVIAVLNYRAVKKYIGVDPIAKPVFKTIIASVVMGVFAKFCFELLHTVLSSHIAVILTIILAAGIYFAIIVLTKAITKKELRSVRG